MCTQTREEENWGLENSQASGRRQTGAKAAGGRQGEGGLKRQAPQSLILFERTSEARVQLTGRVLISRALCLQFSHVGDGGRRMRHSR